MDTQDRLLSVGGQASYPIRDIINQASPTWYTENYYVDGNVSATGDGSEEYPFSTLAEASAASHAAIALSASRHWARRNAIWVCGDALTEDLVALLSGTYSHGIEFHNCEFHADGGVAATAGIISTAVRWLRVQNCKFEGAFSDAVIEFGAGNASGSLIKNNYIQGANNGIDCNASMTMTPQIGHIDGNVFHVTGLAVNDDADKFMVINNIAYSAVATTTAATFVEVMDCNVKLAFNNYISAGDITNCRFPKMDETGT